MIRRPPGRPPGRRGPKSLGEDPTSIAVRLPYVVAQAIERAAAANYESAAQYVRRSAVDRLRAEGFLPKGGDQ